MFSEQIQKAKEENWPPKRRFELDLNVVKHNPDNHFDNNGIVIKRQRHCLEKVIFS